MDIQTKVLQDPEMIAARAEAIDILRNAANASPETKATRRKNLLRWLKR